MNFRQLASDSADFKRLLRLGKVFIYQVKYIVAHFDQKALQNSRVGLQDLQRVSSPGGSGSQPPDGPLDLRLVRPLVQDDQVLTWHAPSRLQGNTGENNNNDDNNKMTMMMMST